MKIVLDPGHGGEDLGAQHKWDPMLIREKDLTLLICWLLKGMLSDDVQLTRTGDYELSLNQRARIANRARADLFISIHLNADPDPDGPGMPEAHGREIWIHPQASYKAVQVAEGIKARLEKGGAFRGIKEGNFAVLRETKMPAVLIEVAFMDNYTDTGKLLHPAEIVQTAILLKNAIEHALTEVSCAQT